MPATTVQAGLAFTHVVEPLPPFLAAGGVTQGVAMRPVETVFRLFETSGLSLDIGKGPATVPLASLSGSSFDTPPPAFTGDRPVRHLGWVRDAIAPLWRIEQDAPTPFTLLSVTTELKVND